MPIAPALERPELHEVMIAARAHAGRALMNGEGADAKAIVRATEGYFRLSEVIRTEGADRAPKPDPTLEFLLARLPQRFADFEAWHARTAHAPIEDEALEASDHDL